MKYADLCLLLTIIGGTWRIGRPTCVLESDFGFAVNCAFKKSGLFRVRNLGGVKAHVGLGFSVGDELGFKESISNVEANRRRSVQGSSKLHAVLNHGQQLNPGKSMSLWPPPASPELSIHSYFKALPTSSTIPPFRPIPPAPERPSVNSNLILINGTRRIGGNSIPTPALMGIVSSTHIVPQSISRLSTNMNLDGKKHPAVAVIIPIKNKPKAVENMNSNNFALRTLASPTNNDIQASLDSIKSFDSIKSLATAANISAEVIELALMTRQKQLLHKNAIAANSNLSNVYKSPLKHSSRNKVMNAPREYYPVGYDKNFDDNFASRVDLPETSFYCGDQKHFPGLYADEDLGCMVFHVCALTDDGLIMKSFLCPESTLFDQTILKCNWWFYVECRSSKKLYDSNIPVSKSYQLMKALTFFSSYKNDSPVHNLKSED